MRIWIFSDLHIEQSDWDLPEPPDCDVIVAAGDIHTPASRGVDWLAALAGGRPVIYVPGNHEWYAVRGDFNVADESRRAADLATDLGIHLLMDDEVLIDGVRFLGATLWTDYAFDGDVERAERVAERSINDHRHIFADPDMTPLRARDARHWHERSRAWLEERFASASDLPTVVVTHHLPHPRSIDPRYAGSRSPRLLLRPVRPRRGFRRGPLDTRPHLSSFDYMVGRTRMVCNPKGYGRRGGADRLKMRRSIRRSSSRCRPDLKQGPAGETQSDPNVNANSRRSGTSESSTSWVRRAEERRTTWTVTTGAFSLSPPIAILLLPEMAAS